MEKLYYEIELPLCRVSGADGDAGRSGRPDGADSRSAICSTERHRARSGGDLPLCRAGIQHQLSQAAWARFSLRSWELPPVKKTKSGYSTNAEVLEKLQRPAPDRARPFWTIAMLDEAEIDLCRRPCQGDRGRRPHPHDVPEHGHGDGPAVLHGPEPAEHPRAHGARQRNSPACSSRATAGCFVDADYSQIELRVLAHIADDTRMQEAFRSGDGHPYGDGRAGVRRAAGVTSRRCMRRHAKAVNFGIVYGISEFSLARGHRRARARRPRRISTVISQTTRACAPICTISSRQAKRGRLCDDALRPPPRDLPELKSSNFNIRSVRRARRAQHARSRARAADIIKLAMLARRHGARRAEAAGPARCCRCTMS